MISKKICSEVTPKIGLTMAVFFALFVVFSFYVISEKMVDRAHEQRLISFVLANQLHQSSDDLTRMARAFVVTGNPRYKKYFQDILDIRDGKKPRPEGYFYGYWDLVLANVQPPSTENGQAIALLDLMRQSGFPDDELGKLTEAKANSDGLTTMEFMAMKLVESVGPDTEVMRERGRLMLHNENYYQAKAKIMGPINDAYLLMEKRTLDAVHNAEYIALLFRLIFIAATLGVTFMLWRSYVSLRATLGGSADEIHTQLVRIGHSDFSTTITVVRGMENSVLAGLSEMQNKLYANEIERKQSEVDLRIASVAFESQEA